MFDGDALAAWHSMPILRRVLAASVLTEALPETWLRNSATPPAHGKALEAFPQWTSVLTAGT